MNSLIIVGKIFLKQGYIYSYCIKCDTSVSWTSRHQSLHSESDTVVKEKSLEYYGDSGINQVILTIIVGKIVEKHRDILLLYLT